MNKPSKTKVLISGRTLPGDENLHRILQILQQSDLQIERCAVDSPADPLHGRTALPDVLIVMLNESQDTLAALASRSAAQRPPLIVIGSTDDSQLMRRAMQAGARDLFPPTVSATELLQALRLIGSEHGHEQPATALGTLTAVINAKGGSGASFVALNLAHMTALQTRMPVALIDLDLQFGTLPSALNLEHCHSLLDALQAAHHLDPMALQGFMAKHDSGVHVLSAMLERLPFILEIQAESLARLLRVARQTYAAVFVDLPRQLDPLTALVLGQSTHNVVVMQQSLAHIRDAKRLLRAMTDQCAVARGSLTLVVNRYNEKDTVREQDIREAVNPPALVLLPNDFIAVSNSLNTGVPLQQCNPGAPIVRVLHGLAAKLNGTVVTTPAVQPRPRRSLRDRLAVSFFRGEHV